MQGAHIACIQPSSVKYTVRAYEYHAGCPTYYADLRSGWVETKASILQIGESGWEDENALSVWGL